MKKLLCITSTLNQGGAETFLMKIFRELDKTKYTMDFCVMWEKEGKYEDEVTSLGGKIYRVTSKSKNPLKCFWQIRNIVKKNNYTYVFRGNEHSLAVLDLLAAKCGGAKTLVMRSTNANSSSTVKRVLHKTFKFLPKIVPNIKIAPSNEAAEYTFGEKNVNEGRVSLLKNGIPVEEYCFNPEIRKRLRKELNIEGKIVIGHIGRFQKQKNHEFLIEVFKKITQMNDRVHLVLIGGNGVSPEKIKEKIEKNSLSEKVSILGNRSDVPALLSAIDVIVFPSFYEGMPNVIIEAQAAGLPCIISDTITKEADITGLVKYLPLEYGAENWAQETLNAVNAYERKSYESEFNEAGYDINDVVKKFTSIVFGE